MPDIRLTAYSHGAGCGCKIAPAVLDQILQQQQVPQVFPNLLVGNQERDDAAVYDLEDGTALISTTDFFMPIVDDPFDFGRIASVNAMSDVYAMGGTPLMAIAILGWPIAKLPPAVANQVLEGSRAACMDAGIPLAGGHSIDSPEPIFGLAVSGRVQTAHLKKNGGAKPGDHLFLTKGLGGGILATAQKKSKLRDSEQNLARDSMIQLNKIGQTFAKLDYVHAMTDVTGFGLLGHLHEMCEASKTTAVLDYASVPLLDHDSIHYYLEQGCIPGGTHRNWESYGHHIGPMTDLQRYILADPQTSGGLLVAVDEKDLSDFQQILQQANLPIKSIGQMQEKGAKNIML